MKKRHPSFPAALGFAVMLFGYVAVTAAEVDFNRDVRPILSDKCYFCHGPDEENRESGLRLDLRDEAIDAIESGDVLDRITSDDADVLMPPPHSNLALTDEDKQTIAKWIDSGAEYDEHWAFKPLPESVEVPEPSQPQWCRQPLDCFIAEKMDEAGLHPAPETNPLLWLRRVALDLTGLPPTPDQISRFEKGVAQLGERAYESAVAELLDSPAFGEHMAVAWLDAARYADSYGYQSDKLNTQWPYRDWVVRAFNDNLPYNDFLTWQLAGDLLENPTRDQKLATAFNRIHRLNNEGGAVFEEWRLENVADRVHTFGTAVLGLTLECCRCHDHKYDPIPTKDFYALSGYFNSIDESGVYDRTEKVPCPSLLLPTDEQQAELDQAFQNLRDAEQRYAKECERAKARYATWKEQQTPPPASIPDLRLALSFDRGFDNTLKKIYHPSESDRAWTTMPELVPVTDSTIARLDPTSADDRPESEGGTDNTVELPRRALSLDGERGVTTSGIEPLDRWTPFSVVVTLRETRRVADRSLIAHHTRGTDCGYNGWDLTLVDGYLESRMYRVWPGNAIGVRSKDPIPVDQWHQITATYDGSSQASGLQLFLNGKPLQTTILRDKIKKSANVKVDHGGEFVVGQRFRARGLAGGLIDDIRLFTRALTTGELRQLATGEVEPVSEATYISAIDQPARAAWDALNEARHAFVMAEEVMDEVPIMEETEQPRETHVLARGQYDAPQNDKTRIDRGVLSGLSLPLPEDAPNNRLGLAMWVTDSRHPLTGRVAVNRFWANFFAEPLVHTPENFGLQGDLPTHPELLDWLARDFIDSGWNVKRLCRNIVLSATYRQSSAITPKSQQIDPTNLLLARGPAHRLTAEQIRDIALAGSGLINLTRGGPPVSPYQPGEDLWRESNGMSPPYQQSVGKALYRRSLYSVWKRTAPLPNMLTFDAMSREVCAVKRSRTNTPLQALVLLNDVQFVEAARSLAAEVLPASDDGVRIDEAFVRLTGRHPDDNELQILLDQMASERDYFTQNRSAASAFIKIGESEPDADLDSVELAAMTAVCQTILNLDATIWKR
ncbi:DUF1553 domain-containing protein [Aporhodopirellula aestuarii]|uniref:DUF1553 domain-containing protein n=1 Tax=Aporhodopirellula aestuarii TaxID=2950107 RepID=A0ABT0U0Y3_9BACT|nr:DUF1553 domain-containing protein [Aporhodopirellula aestuarii]MCM2370528.1 DUF1553 domain-containing protein [Aporhodopirellula aestuarii]